MMSFKKIFLTGLAFTLAGCVTTKTGSGPLSLNGDLEKRYIKYLADYKADKDYNGAFALNPVTRDSYHYLQGGGVDPAYKAKQVALERCGEGCYLFGADDKIVWEGFTPQKDYDSIADIGTVKVKLYNPKIFEITSNQKREFEEYLDEVKGKSGSQNYAFAISDNGYSEYIKYSGQGVYHIMKEDVIRRCILKSSGGSCVLYAVNDELFAED